MGMGLSMSFYVAPAPMCTRFFHLFWALCEHSLILVAPNFLPCGHVGNFNCFLALVSCLVRGLARGHVVGMGLLFICSHSNVHLFLFSSFGHSVNIAYNCGPCFFCQLDTLLLAFCHLLLTHLVGGHVVVGTGVHPCHFICVLVSFVALGCNVNTT